MRRRASIAAATGLVVAVALALTGCSTNGTAAAPARTEAPSTTASSSAAATPTGNASVTACTAYAGATGNPRQVVTTASTKPVLGPAVALVLVNLRGIVSVASVPADPPLQAVFTELTAAVDELSTQLAKGLPPGADPITTPVSVVPARLKAALDAADALCTARGVSPKAG